MLSSTAAHAPSPRHGHRHRPDPARRTSAFLRRSPLCPPPSVSPPPTCTTLFFRSSGPCRLRSGRRRPSPRPMPRCAPPSAREVHYFYVLDDDDRLAGVMPVRHLLAARLDDRVEQVMIPGRRRHPELGDGADRQRVLRHPEAEGLPGDSRRRHAGRDGGQGPLHRRGHRRRARDLRRDLPAARRPRHGDGNAVDVVSRPIPLAALEHRPAASSARSSPRSSKLCCNTIAVLALFIPIVLALAESVSMQSATLTLQSLSDESLKPAAHRRGAVARGPHGGPARAQFGGPGRRSWCWRGGDISWAPS